MRLKPLFLISLLLGSFIWTPVAYGLTFGELESGIKVEGKDDIDAIAADTSARGGVVGFIGVIINLLLALVVGAGLIVFVIAGYRYMTAGGDGHKVSSAKSLMGAALLGIVLAIAAQMILNIISPQFAEKVENPVLKFPTKAPTTP